MKVIQLIIEKSDINELGVPQAVLRFIHDTHHYVSGQEQWKVTTKKQELKDIDPPLVIAKGEQYTYVIIYSDVNYSRKYTLSKFDTTGKLAEKEYTTLLKTLAKPLSEITEKNVQYFYKTKTMYAKLMNKPKIEHERKKANSTKKLTDDIYKTYHKQIKKEFVTLLKGIKLEADKLFFTPPKDSNISSHAYRTDFDELRELYHRMRESYAHNSEEYIKGVIRKGIYKLQSELTSNTVQMNATSRQREDETSLTAYHFSNIEPAGKAKVIQYVLNDLRSTRNESLRKQLTWLQNIKYDPFKASRWWDVDDETI